MNISFNVSTPTLQPPSTQGTDQSQRAAQADKTLTVTITAGPQGAQGSDSPMAITLSYPLIGPEDIDPTEFLENLRGMNVEQLQGLTMTSAVMVLNQMVAGAANDILKGGEELLKSKAEEFKNFFADIEEQAGKAETQLFDLINNSTYPDFNEFLSKMLNSAMELRKSASEARQNLVMGEYKNVCEQAQFMFTSATKNHEAALAEIEATRKQAIGKIVSGCVSFAAGLAGGMVGMKNPSMGFLAGAQAGGLFGSAFGNIIDGSTSIMATKDSTAAADARLVANEADAASKNIQAAQKLLQEAQNVCQDLKDLAKGLADMVLKLYQDFIANQSQIIQRANI